MHIAAIRGSQIYPAGVAVILAVVAFNLLGDGMRDGFDPHSRIR